MGAMQMQLCKTRPCVYSADVSIESNILSSPYYFLIPLHPTTYEANRFTPPQRTRYTEVHIQYETEELISPSFPPFPCLRHSFSILMASKYPTRTSKNQDQRNCNWTQNHGARENTTSRSIMA
jgi:hypothetical protein